MKTKRLGDIAYARSGDKGSNANIGVIVYKEKDYEYLKTLLTEENVANYFQHLKINKVKRYELPNLWALNFILYGALSGGGSLSLRSDAQGKALGQAILEMEIPSV